MSEFSPFWNPRVRQLFHVSCGQMMGWTAGRYPEDEPIYNRYPFKCCKCGNYLMTGHIFAV